MEKNRYRRLRKTIVAVSVILTLLLAAPFSETAYQNVGAVYAEEATDLPRFSDVEGAADYLRQKLVERETNISFIFCDEDISGCDSRENLETDINARAANVWKSILGEARSHTGDPKEGDYLFNSIDYLRYGITTTYVPGQDSSGLLAKNIQYSFVLEISYYTTSEQEAAVEARVNEVLSSLNISGMTDYEKVSEIYDYIIKNVSYDYEHLNDDNYLLKQSAYAALINGTSVCQGYASLFYYMALKAGLDSRIVTGVASSDGSDATEFHAWNIVKIDGKYYSVDATWDSAYPECIYFLKGTGDFINHGTDATSYVEEGDQEISPSRLYDMADTNYFNSIIKTDLTPAVITAGDGVYENNRIIVDVSVSLNGEVLKKGIDYKIIYGTYYIVSGTNSGTCLLKIEGMGLYQSTIEKTINVTTGDATTGATTSDVTTTGETGDQTTSGGGTTSTVTGRETSTTSTEGKVVIKTVAAVKKGTTVSLNGASYKVTAVGKTRTVAYTKGRNNVTSATIPASIRIDGATYTVTSIASGAFKGNKKLRSVVIGKNVKTIGANAFYGCKKLSKITIKSSYITKIGSKAFKSINAKATIKVPAKKLAKYKKLLLKAGVSKKAKIKKL